jgi:7-cyano-7-deazaguanine synthase
MANADTVGALVSGLDSAIMAALLAQEYDSVTPLFVRAGLKWEDAERAALEAYFKALSADPIKPVVELDLGARSIYGRHWSTGSENVPDASRPDEEWYLPGRNLLLLSTAATYGAINGIDRLAIGVLASNPFPDARPDFLRSLENSVRLALDCSVQVLTPLADMHKPDVIQAGAEFPVECALSCADPVDGGHCGLCGKCFERRRGFIAARVPDPTQYAHPSPV